jgi:hypothetical protein
MTRLLRRLARTGPAEIWFRSTSHAHVVREAVQYFTQRNEWNRDRVASALNPVSEEIARAKHALRKRDWTAAETALRSHFVHRPARFPISPADQQRVARLIRERYASSPDDAEDRAEKTLQRRYDLLGYRDLSFQTTIADIDWHFDPVHQRRAPLRFWTRVPYLDPQIGDHKIIWELNRHQHWLGLGRAAWLTGHDRYGTAFAAELESWLLANPPLTGINWASMLEIAFRSLSWLWALHFFAGDRHVGEHGGVTDLLLGLDRQLDHLAQHLSVYFSPNTHLLGEGLALYVAGRALPELTSASRWESLGRKVLIQETGAQILADGGHAELSTHYHRYALDFYLLALAIARKTGDAAQEVFADAVSKLATFCRAMADANGELPTFGDDDGGMLFPICGRAPAAVSDSLALAAIMLDRPELAIAEIPEEVAWMLGGELPAFGSDRPVSAQTSRHFPDTGYAILRSDADLAIVDVGPHGFLNGGHAHADALSLVLSLNGRTLLIDPGTSTYTMDAERRDRFRSSAMHNTVVVDGRSQSIPDGPFHWASRATGRLEFWRSEPEFDCIEASHDGYLPVIHRRAVLRGPDGIWFVADHLLGDSIEHLMEMHWHVSPEWSLRSTDRKTVRLQHFDGSWAAIASTSAERHEFRGDNGGLGWCAPAYGQLVPSVTVRFAHKGRAGFSSVASIAAVAAADRFSIGDVAISCDEIDAWHRIAAVLSSAGRAVLTLFATPNPTSSLRVNGRALQRVALAFGEFATDARMAALYFSEDMEPQSLLALDATRVGWIGSGAFGLEFRKAQDLHLDVTALRLAQL